MRKWILALLTVICTACCALGIAACVPGDLKACTWENEWKHNAEKHWRRCTVPGCNKKLDNTEHEWVLTETETAESCGATGVGVYTCSVCGAMMRDIIPANENHNLELLTAIEEATCGADGSGMYRCNDCHDVLLGVIPATGDHNFDDKWSHNENGHFHICLKGCGVTTEVLPHLEGAPRVTSPTAGLDDGSSDCYCTECGVLMRSEPIIPPNLPASFRLKFVRNYDDAEVPVTVDDDGNFHVTLWAENTYPATDRGTVTSRYSYSFVDVKSVSGGNVSITDRKVDVNYGMTYTYFNEGTGAETVIEGFGELTSSNGSVILRLAGGVLGVNAVGQKTIILRYVTGLTTNKQVVRIEKRLYITAVTFGTANPATVNNLSGIIVLDDTPVYYLDKKSYLY